jgi:ribosomal-protein-alanine N-acetyltransferase
VIFTEIGINVVAMDSNKIFANLPQIETDRLLLRKMVETDVTALFAILSDPEVIKFTPRQPHQSIEDTRALLHRWIALYEQNEVSRWGIVHKNHQVVIGVCGFVNWNKINQRGEIAYILARKYWRQGYTTEAIQEVIKFGFGVMGLNRIEALCEPENRGSIRVLEKVNMQYEGRLREYQFDKGIFHTVDMYSMLRRDWITTINQ